jgi:general nucleoside transport system permease protein
MMLNALGLEIVRARKVHPLVQVLLVIAGIFLAFALSGVFISMTGADPIEAFKVMFAGAFGERTKILETLLRSSPLMLTGLATVIAFRAEIWSIGQEGQLLGGAMMAYALYDIFQPLLYRPALITVIVLGGFVGGALLGLLSGWMKAYFNVDVIISTVMLNYIVTTMLLMLLYDHKFWMGEATYYPRTDTILKDAWYPTLTGDSRLHMGFLIAIALALLLYWVLKRTPYGFDIRALGSNPVATRFKGINVKRMIMITMLISGGLAGLAGVGEVFGVHHNVSSDISPGYGYTGIIVAMVAELNPLIVILVAILFGGLINGSVILVTTLGTHTSIIFVIQAFVLLSVLISRALMKYRIRRIAHVD